MLVLAVALLAGCGGERGAPTHEPAPTEQSAAPEEQATEPEPNEPAPAATERFIEEIAAGITEGMPCEDALAQLPEPAGSFSGADVTVTGIELPDTDEERITYVWE